MASGTRSIVSEVHHPGPVVDWLRQQLGECVRVSKLLPGATTAEVSTFAVAGRHYVLKLFNRQFFVDEQPDRAAHEAAVLEVVTAIDIPTPELVGVDGDGSHCGAPAVLMTRLPGARRIDGTHAQEIARIASRMHSAEAIVPWTFERYADGYETRPPNWGSSRQLWSEVFEVIDSEPSEANWGFIHRDFNATNLLSQGDTITGVVDWLSGCMGPHSIDAARIRLDPTMNGDSAFADALTEEFAEIGHMIVDPYWDLVDAVDLLPYYQGIEVVDDWGSPVQRQRLEAWVKNALDRL